MSYTKPIFVSLTAVLVSGAFEISAKETPSLTPPGAPQVRQQLVGGGKWQSRHNGSDVQGWHIQLKRLDDDSLAGRITIVGSPLIQQARIEGQVSGSDVYGVLVGDDDIQVATFTGSLFKGGMSGTYTTSDGDSGNWNWDGPMPKEPSAFSDQASAASEITALGLEAPDLGPSALGDQPAVLAEPSVFRNQPSAPEVNAGKTGAVRAPRAQ